jgi:hypothetical protein
MLGEFVVKRIWRFLFLAMIATIALATANPQSDTSSKQDSPVGDWRGMSMCQVKPSGCHDEDSLYHFRRAQSGEFELQAEKIVDGKPVTLGKGPCNYDAARQLLCPVPGSGATLSFDVSGDEMQGTMKMGNGTIWRKIKLKRMKER